MASDPASTSAQRRLDPLAPEDTVELLNRIKGGDEAALDALLRRCIPPLRRWARGRLPRSARGMLETMDLVQDAVFAAVRRLDVIEIHHQGALQAYFREAVMNRIRDLVRQEHRRPHQTDLPPQLADDRQSPLDEAIGVENGLRYENAVQRLRPADREAIIGRLELQYTYDELAVVLDKPTAAAARTAVTRAMRRLADAMHHVS